MAARIRAISPDRAGAVVDTIIGPVTAEASCAGLCRVDLPGREHLQLEEVWAHLDLPRRTPKPGDTLSDFGLELTFVDIDLDGIGCDDGGAPGSAAAGVARSSGIGPQGMLERCCDVLEGFFAGELTRDGLSFSDLAVDIGHRSSFGQRISQGMRAIPGGCVSSYSALARAAGNPRASRGAGAVVGRNPVGLIVPCHRVVGAAGRLTGYGGSLPLKVVLLALEQRMAAN